jgi:hypothetical protein
MGEFSARIPDHDADRHPRLRPPAVPGARRSRQSAGHRAIPTSAWTHSPNCSGSMTPLARRPPAPGTLNGEPLPDLLGPGMWLLFVGINPGLSAVAVQAPFPGRRNRFFPALRSRDHLPVTGHLRRLRARRPRIPHRLRDRNHRSGAYGYRAGSRAQHAAASGGCTAPDGDRRANRAGRGGVPRHHGVLDRIPGVARCCRAAT